MEQTHPLYEYSLKTRRAPTRIRSAMLLGLCGMVITGLLIFISPRPIPSVFISTGLLMAAGWLLFGSVTAVVRTQKPTGALGRWLRKNADRLFPPFHFVIIRVFVLTIAFALWQCMPLLGLDVHAWQHSLYGLILLLFPIEQVLQKYAQSKRVTTRISRLQQAATYLLTALITGLIAGSLHRSIWQPGDRLTDDAIIFLVLIWVPASLIIIVCFIQTLARLLNSTSPSTERWLEDE